MRAMKDSIWPYGRIAWHFEFRESDHDVAEKEFPRRAAARSTAEKWWR